MKFICSECNKLINERDTITQDINGRIRFLCKECYDKWCGKDAEESRGDINVN